MAVTFDPAKTVGAATLSNGNKTVTSPGGGGGESYTSLCTDVFADLMYTEAEVIPGAYYMGVGLVGPTFDPAVDGFGFDTKSIDFDGDGNAYYNGSPDLFTGGYSDDGLTHRLQVCIRNGKYYFRIDNRNWNNNASANPVTEVLGRTIPFAGPYRVAVYCYDDSGTVFTWNLKALASEFLYTMPSGYSAYDPGGGGAASDVPQRPVRRADHLLRR